MFVSIYLDKDLDYVFIGDIKFIEQCRYYLILLEGCGYIGEYVVFYFGYFFLMLYNIYMGYRGIV